MNNLTTYRAKGKDIIGAFETSKELEHRVMMRVEIQEELARLDNEIFGAASHVCPKCGGQMYAHGKTGGRTYYAVCGEIRIRLHRLRCTSCGHIAVPGSVLIPEAGVSSCLGEKLCDLASKMPYEKAGESLAIQHGINISTKKYWSYVQEEAEHIGDVLAEEAEALYERGVEPDQADLGGEKPLIIGIDGGHVRGWKENPSFEVKCATVATGSCPTSNGRRKLVDRVGYAAECSLEDFRKRISVLALKSGYLTASERIFVSDGASWISHMIENYFPGSIHVLDMYHLKHKITQLFGVRTEGEDGELRDEAIIIADRYAPDDLINALNSWTPPEHKMDERDDLVFYIKSNRRAIENHKLVFIHGSGWIEKGVDLMVSRRLKNRGMAWTTRGCSHMLPFAVLRYNKRWGVYWNQRKGLDLSYAA